MKQTSLFFVLLLITCGGAETESIVVQDSSNDTVAESTITTVDDTTTITTQETTTTIQDSTTITIPKNKCDDCEYVTITELISNINNVPKYAWNDYQRISKENNIFENDSFEIIINIGPSTDLYFQDNEKYIQKGISF